MEPLTEELLSDNFIEREFTLVAVDEPPLTLLFKKKGRRQRFRNQLIPEHCTLLRRRRLSQPLPYDEAFCDCYRRYSSSSCLVSAIRLPTCTQTTQMLCLKIRLLTHWTILVVVARRHQSAKHEREKKAPSGSLELVTPEADILDKFSTNSIANFCLASSFPIISAPATYGLQKYLHVM